MRRTDKLNWWRVNAKSTLLFQHIFKNKMDWSQLQREQRISFRNLHSTTSHDIFVSININNKYVKHDV